MQGCPTRITSGVRIGPTLKEEFGHSPVTTRRRVLERRFVAGTAVNRCAAVEEELCHPQMTILRGTAQRRHGWITRGRVNQVRAVANDLLDAADFFFLFVSGCSLGIVCRC